MSTVRAGQVWADCDPRSPDRHIVVVSVDGDTVQVALVDRRGRPARGHDPLQLAKPGRRTRIRLDRFVPGPHGYRLVTQPGEACAFCAAFGSSEWVCECERWCGAEKCSDHPAALDAYARFAQRALEVPTEPAVGFDVDVKISGDALAVTRLMIWLGGRLHVEVLRDPTPHRGTGQVTMHVWVGGPKPVDVAPVTGTR